MSDTSALYDGREQSLVKHFILQNCLCRFAHIIGFHWDAITYVDCFSGPWSVRSADLADSSFAIALAELRKARETLRGHGRDLSVGCMFLERDPAAYRRLSEYADGVADATVRTANARLTDAMGEVLGFVHEGGNSSFPFIFIDPTGWSGLDLEDIRPLLRVNPGEVLINFMTDYVRRFVESPQGETVETFDRFFGCTGMRDRLQAIHDPQDREDELFRAYAAQVRRAGGYRYACAAVVLYPAVDRSYFHLIYATRHRRGVQVFKEVEQRAVGVMASARASTQHRRRVGRTSQPELFAPEFCHQSRRVDVLRERYLGLARSEVGQAIRTRSHLHFDTAWDLAMAWPLVWDCDVKDWIAEWQQGGRLTIQNMQPRQRVPKLEAANRLVWRT